MSVQGSISSGSQPSGAASVSASTRQIQDVSKNEMIPMLIFAIVWNSGVWGILAWAWPDMMRHFEWAMLIPLIGLPAAGAIVLFIALRHAVTRMRYGRSVFDLQNALCVPGGAVIGRIHIPRAIRPAGAVQLRLACLAAEVKRFGTVDTTPNYVNVATVVSEQFCTLDKIPVGALLNEIPVCFRIPHDAKPSDPARIGPQLAWRLEAKCKCAGVHYAASFFVPILAGQIPPDVHKVHDPTAAFRSGAAGHAQISDRRIHFTRLADGGCEADADPGRGSMAAAIIFVVGSVFVVIASVLFAQLPSWKDVPGIVFGVVAAPLLGLFLFVGGFMMVVTTGSVLERCTIVVRHGALIFKRSYWIFSREMSYGAPAISDLVAEIDSSVGTSTTYGVKLKCAAGKGIWLVGSMGQADAKLLEAEFKRALGR
jgi:hypothetical protein